MASAGTVLSIGPLSVRSSKASDRLKLGESFLADAKPVYTVTGLSKPYDLFIYGKKISKIEPVNDEPVSVTVLGSPVFFEQTPYIVYLDLPDAEDARIFSPLASWCDSADWDSKSKRLTLPLNFGNDLGDFELCWEWLAPDGVWHESSMRAQVFSFKLDIQTHFKWMIADVTERLNWMKLDLLKQTSWGWSRDDSTQGDQKTWLLIFQEVRSTMTEGFHRLIKQHRRRLMTVTLSLPLHRVKRLPRRLEERAAEALKDNPEKRFAVEKKSLNADTPENRYMKHILTHTLNDLNELIERIKGVDRISDVFKKRLQDWSDEWSQMKRHHFWQGIGGFHGLKRESKTLSQDPLYAGIRRSWHWLKQGMQFIDNDLKGGIQNAAQLYEIWCLVKIDAILKELGWECKPYEGLHFDRTDDDWERDEPSAAAIKMTYWKGLADEQQLDLLFQPTAGKKPEQKNIWDGIMALPTVQRPDIVLRLHRKDLPHCPTYTWIFDAKYRIEGNDAPDDAINQMHRYRDAILWSTGEKEARLLTRESIGAFVLYPGDENKNSRFPQIDSIERTNIGAFPLLPQEGKGKLPVKLKEHLTNLLDIKTDFEENMAKQTEYFSSVPASKKASLGIIGIATVRDYMNKEYWEKCRLYRLPCDEADKATVNPENWDYIAPQKEGEKPYGLFSIKKI